MSKGTLIVLTFIAAPLEIFAQQRLPMDSVFRILSDSFPQEKVYLQIDRDRYMAGDTIWFKAYLYSGIFPADLSTGLYVELSDDQGRLVQEKYFPVLRGSVSLGEMELKDSLPEGAYVLRAYTPWMTNFDPAFFYERTFPVYNARLALHKAAPPPGPKDVEVQFLPEGGDAVENVQTTVAFRATDERGLPVSVDGRVVDDKGDSVAGFTTFHDGMGDFDFTPVKGHTYTAVVRTPLGEKRVPLPPALPDGVVLNASQLKSGVQFVLRADSLSRFVGQRLEIVASMYGQMAFRARTTMTPDMPFSSGFIPTKKFVTGMLRITVLDSTGVPLAERMVFIRPTDIRIPVALGTGDTINVAAKGYNSIAFRFPDSVGGTYSVSVTDAEADPVGPDQTSILSGLLLSDDLKGKVYNPAWYFKPVPDSVPFEADSTRIGLDLVMRTHGWRRFDWVALERGQFPEISRTDKNYITFKGQAFNESGKKIVKSTTLNMILTTSDSSKRLLVIPVDSLGNFTIDGMAFFDTANAYFQLNKKGYAAENVMLKLEHAPQFPFSASDIPGYLFPNRNVDTGFVRKATVQEDLVADRIRAEKVKELKEIFIQGRKTDPLQLMDQRYTSGMFSGGQGFSFDLVNSNPEAAGYPDILTFLQGRVAGLQINGAYPNISVKYRGRRPAFFVDEIYLDIDAVEQVPVADIAYVKVLSPPFFGAPGGGGGGAIAIYTKKGGDAVYQDEGLNRLSLVGYARIRQFYAPKYQTKTDEPDFRQTLSWTPFLVPGTGTEEARIHFYNNDACRRFKVVLEGMGDDGRLAHEEWVLGAPENH